MAMENRDLPDWVQERRKGMIASIEVYTGELRSMPWSKIDTQDLEKLLKAFRR